MLILTNDSQGGLRQYNKIDSYVLVYSSLCSFYRDQKMDHDGKQMLLWTMNWEHASDIWKEALWS